MDRFLDFLNPYTYKIYLRLIFKANSYIPHWVVVCKIKKKFQITAFSACYSLILREGVSVGIWYWCTRHVIISFKEIFRINRLLVNLPANWARFLGGSWAAEKGTWSLKKNPKPIICNLKKDALGLNLFSKGKPASFTYYTVSRRYPSKKYKN